MDNKYAGMLASKVNAGVSDLILLAMPDKAVMARVIAIQHGHGGKMVYSYDGVPFLEVWPPEIESVREDNTYKIKATQNYRILK